MYSYVLSLIRKINDTKLWSNLSDSISDSTRLGELFSFYDQIHMDDLNEDSNSRICMLKISKFNKYNSYRRTACKPVVLKLFPLKPNQNILFNGRHFFIFILLICPYNSSVCSFVINRSNAEHTDWKRFSIY